MLVNSKEALARININKLLEEAGWRFFPKDGPLKRVAERRILPGFKLRIALLTLHLLVDTTLYDTTKPRQEWRMADCSSILQERPELHTADKAGE